LSWGSTIILNPIYATVVAIVTLFTLLYFRVNLAVALLTSSLTLAVLTLNPYQILTAYYMTGIRPINIDVIVSSAVIAIMANIYKESNVITKLSNALLTVLKKVWLTISLIPALFGLLPVPGGALMSAPLVSEISRNINLDSNKVAYVNIWFRHLIAPIYPLTQVIILTAALSGFNAAQIALYNIPLALVMYVVGFIPVRRELRNTSVSIVRESVSNLLYIIPLLVAVFIVVLGVNIITAVLLGLISLIILVRPSKSLLLKSTLSKDVLMVVLTSYAALSIREVLMMSGFPELFTSLFTDLPSTFLTVSIIAISMLLGFVLGVPTGALAITVPLITNVTHSIEFVSLTLILTYLSYMVSPSHLCLVLTLKFFKVDLHNIYKYLLPTTFLTFILMVITHLLISTFL
jgi:integral membrane protein (TIGR00529 family)